ncbi:MAG: phosphate acyltransferase PlsX [Myxococcales bacterium]|nr:phosphate acyltransferase PlsX [Myxococcales bacterium]
MPAYRFCRTDDIQLLTDAVNACCVVHCPNQAALSSVDFKREIRELNVWSSSCMVASNDGDPIAVVTGAKRERETLVHRIGVHPGFMRRGHAQHLLESLGQKLAVLGPPRLVAEVPEDLPAVRRLFESVGYQAEERFADFSLSKPLAASRAAGEVTEAGLDDLLRYGSLDPSVPRSWERALETLQNRKDQLEGLAIESDAKPSVALRQGRNSSMRLAIQAVRDGTAQGVVSAGNTGALMAMSKIVLKTLPGIHRPALATIFPTKRGETVVLDVGANAECTADNLVQFAVMGEVFARNVLGLENPSIGILNVGAENLKGNEAVKKASMMLQETSLPIKFHGFIEGDDIAQGTVDVVVADGFSGNIALKTAEGTARLYAEYLRRAFRSSTMAGLGYLLARRALKKLRARLDPRRYNGAVSLGLNGITVKSHGGSDALE